MKNNFLKYWGIPIKTQSKNISVSNAILFQHNLNKLISIVTISNHDIIGIIPKLNLFRQTC